MILLLSTADTELLAARASGAPYRIANPTRLELAAAAAGCSTGADVVVVRLLGGRRAWPDGLDALRRRAASPVGAARAARRRRTPS